MRIAGVVEPGDLACQMLDGRQVARSAQDGCIAVVDGSAYQPQDATDGGGGLGPWLIRSYRRLGIERTLAALNGDFAVVLWDAAERMLSEDHSYVQSARHGLAMTLYLLSDLESALELFAKVHEMRSRSWGFGPDGYDLEIALLSERRTGVGS